jgi:sulfur carrier protein
MERVKGIEPSYAAWEAAVLPLNYTRVLTVRTLQYGLSACAPRKLRAMQTTLVSFKANGELRTLPAGSTVADLLAKLDTAGKRIAVERNGEIVPRSRHAVTVLEDGDQLEIVVAVGGG